MGDATSIEWTDATWNCVRGCSRVSAGCENCYAERVAARFSGPGQPYAGLAKMMKSGPRWTRKVRLVPEHLADPLRWQRPRRIFVNSMSDIYHEELSNETIALVFAVMAAAPRHTYQVLTKRAKRMREWFAWLEARAKANRETASEALLREAVTAIAVDGIKIKERDFDIDIRRSIAAASWPLPWVWLGVSTEDQETAEARIPELLRTPAAVRFISAEPLIGELDLDLARCDNPHHGPEMWGLADDCATPWCNDCDSERSFGHWLHHDGGIDWVIAGCESGPGARACSTEWLRKLRDQCADAGTAFFLKQGPASLGLIELGRGSHAKGRGEIIAAPYLDGVQHIAFPEISHE